MIRPDLVDVWIFRERPDGPEILLLRRVPGRVLPGLWQGVSGSLEPGERVVDGALRELREETGFERPVVEAFFDLDHVNLFHYAGVDAILAAAVFAARVRQGVEPVLSHEHDAARWLPLDAAIAEVIWPGYREAIRRIGENLLDPARARWFEIAPDGLNVIR
ncbi:MAG TPA: NUDIX domain-containing protein [Candidatus Limnocylindrales bacterium]